MRRLLVNVYVRATLSFLEVFCSIIYCITVHYTIHTNPATLIEILILYMIVLPYAFLMNTSHNKDRIMEHGWKHVFQNLLGNSSQNNVANIHTSERMKNMKKATYGSSKIREANVRQEIFSISSSVANKLRKNDADRCKKLSFENEPSSSMGHRGTRVLHASNITTLDANKLPQQEDNDENTALHLLVLKMIQYIQVEERYLEYFKELVAYQYKKKDKNINLDFQFELLPNYIPNCTTENVVNKIKGKYSKKTPRKSSRKTQLESTRNKDGMNESQNQIAFKGEGKDRIMIRQTILTQIRETCKKDNMYDSLIEQLIDAEESFVQ